MSTHCNLMVANILVPNQCSELGTPPIGDHEPVGMDPDQVAPIKYSKLIQEQKYCRIVWHHDPANSNSYMLMI